VAGRDHSKSTDLEFVQIFISGVDGRARKTEESFSAIVAMDEQGATRRGKLREAFRKPPKTRARLHRMSAISKRRSKETGAAWAEVFSAVRSLSTESNRLKNEVQVFS
jgi:hypothetical protein